PPQRAEVRSTDSEHRRRQAGSRRPTVVPWLVAATSLVAAIVAWWPGAAPDPQAMLTERRAALITAGARPVSWSATGDVTAASASGDVVWDDASQEGYMRIVMLQSNDPRAFQYQLWIFDAGRDARYPVDGGVFDMPPASADVIVPIRARVPVGSATMFAITVERPGGVVVSDRERIVLIAEFG
ncbi:MAG TPA: anti-sigma factor, partial [Gammaproteobacteria bacterium]|nr:anti-sigma factor [Gammaproteobacteria bacterium]